MYTLDTPTPNGLRPGEAGVSRPNGVSRLANEALQRLKVNEAARLAPIGGQFSTEGIDNLKKEADIRTHDIGVARQMIGLGGSIADPYGY